MESPDRIVVNGSAIVDIPTFYDEMNRVFMSDEDWKLGPSLDALNDMLYGGYGALAGTTVAIVEWRDIEATRSALGVDATLAFLVARSRSRRVFNGSAIADQISALREGGGKTYFDIVLEIFSEHDNVMLKAL